MRCVRAANHFHLRTSAPAHARAPTLQPRRKRGQRASQARAVHPQFFTPCRQLRDTQPLDLRFFPFLGARPLRAPCPKAIAFERVRRIQPLQVLEQIRSPPSRMLCLLGALPEALPARTCRLMHRPGASVLGLCGRAFRHGILLGSLLGNTPLSPLLFRLQQCVDAAVVRAHLVCYACRSFTRIRVLCLRRLRVTMRAC